jgi:monovalent cation:H+ antiporter-2, CPA2 family
MSTHASPIRGTPPCEHAAALDTPPRPHVRGCEECLAMGSRWVHLRVCLACGHVGCCDSSPNHHATRHFHGTGHPLMASMEPGEQWGWCFVDEADFELTYEPRAAAPPA